MKKLIKEIVDVWDPYDLYSFPENEYLEFSNLINDFINLKSDLSVDSLSQYLYEIIPPLINTEIKSLKMIEYDRVSKLIMSILAIIK